MCSILAVFCYKVDYECGRNLQTLRDLKIFHRLQIDPEVVYVGSLCQFYHSQFCEVSDYLVCLALLSAKHQRLYYF